MVFLSSNKNTLRDICHCNFDEVCSFVGKLNTTSTCFMVNESAALVGGYSDDFFWLDFTVNSFGRSFLIN